MVARGSPNLKLIQAKVASSSLVYLAIFCNFLLSGPMETEGLGPKPCLHRLYFLPLGHEVTSPLHPLVPRYLQDFISVMTATNTEEHVKNEFYSNEPLTMIAV